MKDYILRELDKFDMINPTEENIKKYYTTLTGVDNKEVVEEETNQIKDRLFDYERNGRGSEEQYKKDLERLERLQNSNAFDFDTLNVEQKKQYLTEYLVDDMFRNKEISYEDAQDFYNHYDQYIAEYIQYKQSNDILNDYTLVDLLNEFKDISNVDKLNDIFEKNHWKLLRTNDNYYQLYFGKNVQVDNMVEYGFSHLLDEKDTKKELERFINYRIELEKNEKELEIDI